MRIYVGNLPYNTTSEGLRELFESHGVVEEATVVTDRETGRSRGFGFIQMPDEDGAKAIESLNGADSGGRPLTVNEARPQERRSGGGGGGGGGFGGGGDRDRDRDWR